MSLPEENKVSVETFYKMREETDQLLEYADGIVYMSPSPSTRHQRVSSRLQAKLLMIRRKGSPDMIIEVLSSSSIKIGTVEEI